MEAKKEISELVQNEEWQTVRKSLLGQWKTDPVKGCRVLMKYLGPIDKTHNDKIRIVMNYLTGSGFRMGKIKHPCIQKIRTGLSMEIEKRKAKNQW